MARLLRDFHVPPIPPNSKLPDLGIKSIGDQKRCCEPPRELV
jgi:hypothetical protein